MASFPALSRGFSSATLHAACACSACPCTFSHSIVPGSISVSTSGKCLSLSYSCVANAGCLPTEPSTNVPWSGLFRFRRHQTKRKEIYGEDRSTSNLLARKSCHGESMPNRIKPQFGVRVMTSSNGIRTAGVSNVWEVRLRETDGHGEDLKFLSNLLPKFFERHFCVARGSILRKFVAAIALGYLFLGISSAEATDALKTCGCLLKECRVELARCIADPGCAANIACLQTCNNRPDETECQIGCGNLFENQVVDQFNDCAVSSKGCVPQKQNDGSFPVPSPGALVPDFRVSDFTGKWYISSGLNQTFDTFDCQLHEFSSSSPNKLTGNLSWRIPTPDGGFFTRSAVQNFVQDASQPAVLYNHNNITLHYEDDWYILSSKIEKRPDDYVFVYYRGRNDAWDGYGGAVVYTRSRILPTSIVPELSAAAKRAGLDFKKFKATDNSCGPEPPLFARLEKKVEQGEEALAREVRNIEEAVQKEGKREINFLSKEAQDLKREEELFLKELGEEEKSLLSELKMGVGDIERLFGRAITIRKVK